MNGWLMWGLVLRALSSSEESSPSGAGNTVDDSVAQKVRAGSASSSPVHATCGRAAAFPEPDDLVPLGEWQLSQ